MTLDPQFGEVLLRLGVATLLGAIVGTNRHVHEQPAGLRTHALVGLASAMAVLIVVPAGAAAAPAIDAESRVVQGILTGVGFIGAGVIMQRPRGNRIRGLTTAAAIWITSVFGALCGHGRIDIAVAGCVLLLLTLVIGEPIEEFARRVLGRRKGSAGDPGE